MLLSLFRQFLLNENFLSSRILLSLLGRNLEAVSNTAIFVECHAHIIDTLHITSYIYMRRVSSQY